MAIYFDSTEELVNHLRQEKMKGRRFATRYILVQGCQAWDDLTPKLALEVDRVISLSDFCTAPDVFPNMEQLKLALKENKDNCSSILLTPLAEYIRIDPEASDTIGWLAELPSESVNRIYVPLLAAEGFFHTAIKRVARYHEGLLPDYWVLQGEGSSEVIVAPFCAEEKSKNLEKGIQEYLSSWSQKSIRKAWLVTEMAPWLSVQQAWGECRVRIYPSSFDYVRRNTRWDDLRDSWGSPEQWEWLSTQIVQDEKIDQLAARLLKVVGYDRDQLFYMWQGVAEHERWLIWLWSKASSNPDTYLHTVMQESESIEDFRHHIVTSIFLKELPVPLSACQERRHLLRWLNINFMPAEFWEDYKSLADPIHKISVLTDTSQQERKQILACVKELLTSKIDPVGWWGYLEVAFPALAWYMQPVTTGDEFVDRYFRVFNRCRVKDFADEHLNALIDQWADGQMLWNYPARSDFLSSHRADKEKILWVDAMGIEWTGLLCQQLIEKGDIDCNVTATRCNLPSTTEANKEWVTGEKVERGLDDIAHHYDYSYPESFLKAMDTINNISDKALDLLTRYPVVVITSDHGLSRFAVIHAKNKETPEGLVAESTGRYASLTNNKHQIEPDNSVLVNKGHVIWLNHNRFQSAGPCRGETHGGATPEECLSPVIVINKTSKREGSSPRFEVANRIVKLNSANEGLLEVKCSRAITGNIELRSAGYQVLSRPSSSLNFSFLLKGWKPGTYKGYLFSSNRLAGEISFDVVKGIIEQDFGL